MESDATLKAVYTFIDKEGRKGSTSIRLPFSTSASTAMSYCISLGAVIQGMSDAVLRSIDLLYQAADPDAVKPETGENINTKVSLFYREGDIYEAITIPAAKTALYETEGPYTSIRVDPNADAMVAWVDNWADISSNLKTKEGEQFPQEYLTGGKLL